MPTYKAVYAACIVSRLLSEVVLVLTRRLLLIISSFIAVSTVLPAGNLTARDIVLQQKAETTCLWGKELKLEAYTNHVVKPVKPAHSQDEWYEAGPYILTMTGDVVRNQKSEYILDSTTPGLKCVTYTITQKWRLAGNPNVTVETTWGKSARYTVAKVLRFEMLTERNPEKMVAECCGLERSEMDIAIEPADAELFFNCDTSAAGPGTVFLQDHYGEKVEIPVTIAARGSRMPEVVTPLPKEKIIKEKETYYVTDGSNYYRWILTYVAVPEWKNSLEFRNYSARTGISDIEPVKWPMGTSVGYGEQMGKGVFAGIRGLVKLPGAWVIIPTKITVPPVPADRYFRDVEQHQLVYNAKSFSQYSVAPKSAAAKPQLVAATEWKAVSTDITEFKEQLTTTTFHYNFWRLAP